ncbi:MAG: M28 family peptidase, partial [Phycisphaerales bacterium]|nr:M28 family peptidase [Phycisphaerales bacterium]
MTHLRYIVPLIPALGVLAQEAPTDEVMDFDREVEVFNDHLVTLASPWMEGRVPGSDGMERAKDYCEYYLRQAGLAPAFPSTMQTDEGEVTLANSSYRQPFELGGSKKVTEANVRIGDRRFTQGRDFSVTGMGDSGEVTAPLVFVGYSIDNGPDGYSSYGEDDSLEGHIAVMLRFEPMNEEGKSLWSERGPWSGRAGFNGKLRAATERGASGIIIVNTPGADDPRTNELMDVEGSSRTTDVPVVMMTADAASSLISGLTDKSLMDLRHHADQGGGIVDLGGEATILTTIERKPLMAENVAGVLPGKGDLADEYIVMGAHLDHLGMGYFGSRSGPGELHPGADDNASGSAAILMLADRLTAQYAELPEDANARSIVFMLFSGEESGLNGSRHYVSDPPFPIESHALMCNFDMIGRVKNGRLSVSGANTGEGLSDDLAPIFDESPLEIVQPERMSGASDHTSFLSKQIPVLFAIIADFHADYHTPQDISSKINRVDSVRVVDLFERILLQQALRPERLAYQSGRTAPAQRARTESRVRFGIIPGSYDEEDKGI